MLNLEKSGNTIYAEAVKDAGNPVHMRTEPFGI
jgi:hypothetical protein